MLADSSPAATRFREPAPATPELQRISFWRRRSVVGAFAFLVAMGLVLVYALRGGGSYDLVTFEQQGLVIWWVLAIGIALGLLPRRRPSTAALLLLGALVGYAAWTALSLTWTQSAELTMVELARSLDYLGLVALAAFVLDRDTWGMALAGLGFGALLVCAVALGSRLAPGVFGVDRIDQFLHSDRLSYPFGYWNAVAAWGAMCTALAITWSAHDSSRVRRAVALGFVPVAVSMTYLTYSRAGVAGTAVALIAAIGLSRNRITVVIHAAAAAAASAVAILAVRGSSQIAHSTGTHGAGRVFGALVLAALICAATGWLTGQVKVDRPKVPVKLRRPLTAGLVIAVAAGAAAAGPRLVSDAWHSFKRTPTVSNSTDPATRLTSLAGTRYLVWKAAIQAFDAHPAGGTGAGTFEFWWNQHAPDQEFVRDAHNVWLENMAELGVPGLLLVVAVAAAALGVAITARVRARGAEAAGVAAAVLAAWIVYLLHATVDWMWESTAVTVLGLAGVAVLGVRLSRGPLRLHLSLRVALAAVAAVAAILQLPGMLSSTDVRRSQSAERAGNPRGALALARDAVSAEPWSATAHEQEALVLEAAGHLRQAKHEESVAISEERTNYAHWRIRSRIETELGQLDQADRDYRRAYELRPHALVFAVPPAFRLR